jgi:hypothetical protein
VIPPQDVLFSGGAQRLDAQRDQLRELPENLQVLVLGWPGTADTLRAWPSGISRTRMAGTEKILAAPAAAAAASPSKVSAALIRRPTSASADTWITGVAAVRGCG